jgi:hypothetical protein
MNGNINTILIGCLCFIALSCHKSDPTPVDTTDKIKILTVTPTTGLNDGQSTNFSVKVSYNLYTQKTGTLMIGFNNGTNVGSSVMVVPANKVINSGSGESTFDVSATVKNWGTQGDFFVYVNLSENPLPVNSTWTPFASDHLTLIPKQ